MGQTVNYQIPYPELTDTVDVPRDFKAMADKVDTVLKTQGDSSGNTVTLRKDNITIESTAWKSSSVFADYPFEAEVTFAELTTDYLPTLVTPDHANRDLDNLFSPYVGIDTGKFVLYAKSKPASQIKIENALFTKAVGE